MMYNEWCFLPMQIEVLKEIVDAVCGKCEVYLDGGVRRGTDVLKALALGARAVFIGRPVLWGLAYKVHKKVLKSSTMQGSYTALDVYHFKCIV